ncbi:MAG: response regulator transcription factor [Planctomycetes bacterium]|nr:response regulator transcription factor [Planctomycetota bacterium]
MDHASLTTSRDRGVVILESHHGIRSFLRSLVNDIPGLAVAGEAGDCGSARQLLELAAPSVIVANPLLGPYGAFDVFESMDRGMRDCQLVMYCRDRPAAVVIDQSLRLKSNIVTGEDSVEEIRFAIESARDQVPFYSTSIRRELATSDLQEPRVALSENLASLTPKRLAVLLLMAWGYSVKEASVELEVSVKAVDSQLDRLRKGLRIRNRVDLAMLCLREGLINGYVEGFVTNCPTCKMEIHLGIAQWIQAGHNRLEVSCRECCSSWLCQRDAIRRLSLDPPSEESSHKPADAMQPHFGPVRNRF